MSLNSVLSSIPLIGGLFDNSEDRLLEELQANKKLWSDLKVPELQYEAFKPEDMQYAGDFNPEAAQYSLAKEDPAIREKQLGVLSKLAGLSESGLSEEDALGFAQARDQAARQARQGSEAALQNAQARGVAGSGLEFMLREQANQAAADRARMSAMEQAANTAKQRALYTQAFGNALSGVRGEDYRANAGNADIINAFNQANTQARNTAQAQNLANRQTVMNQNTGTRNAANMANIERKSELGQQNFNNQLQRLGGMTNAGQGMAQGYAAQNAARTGERGLWTKGLFDMVSGAAGKKGG